MLKILYCLFYAGIYALLERNKCLGYSTVERNHGAGTVSFATHGTELEAVAGEGKRTGAVAVGVVNEQFWNLWNIKLHALLTIHGEEVFLVGLLDMVEQFGELLSEERADDGWWSFVGTETMGIGGRHDAGLQ